MSIIQALLSGFFGVPYAPTQPRTAPASALDAQSIQDALALRSAQYAAYDDRTWIFKGLDTFGLPAPFAVERQTKDENSRVSHEHGETLRITHNGACIAMLIEHPDHTNRDYGTNRVEGLIVLGMDDALLLPFWKALAHAAQAGSRARDAEIARIDADHAAQRARAAQAALDAWTASFPNGAPQPFPEDHRAANLALVHGTSVRTITNALRCAPDSPDGFALVLPSHRSHRDDNADLTVHGLKVVGLYDERDKAPYNTKTRVWFVADDQALQDAAIDHIAKAIRGHRLIDTRATR